MRKRSFLPGRILGGMTNADVDIPGLLQLACDIALEAGALLSARLHTAGDFVETKSTLTDMVTQVDRDTEALIVGRILAARPDDGLLGEEGAAREGTSGVRWVIDPLDGTTNYLYAYPAYAVSIGVEAHGEMVAGAVLDVARHQLFAAGLGRGSTLDGVPIRVSARDELGTALIATGFGYQPEMRAGQAATLARIIPLIRDVRRAGSAALDLCAVACGRVDAYYELGLNAWDLAAGALIVREAGGTTSAFDGTPVRSGSVVAGPPRLVERLRTLVA